MPAYDLPIGYQTELHLHAVAWTRSIADWLRKGVVLLIDYGYAAAEYYRPDRVTGTLR